MSGYSEDDVRRAAELREWVMKQILDKQEELERLRATLSIIDSVLKQGSFRAAAVMTTATTSSPEPARPHQVSGRQAAGSAAERPSPQARQASFESTTDKDIRPLKRAKDDMLLANAEVTPNSITIVPAPGIDLTANTPPFKSFFLGRILDGMKAKDNEKVTQGALAESGSMSYKVDEDAGGIIRKITIANYREKERLTEIFNTSSWVFTRMLEKAGR